MRQHFHYIDRLKGIAILAVIMGHFLLFVLGKKGILLEIIGSFHMPLFMFLSGIVATAPNIRKVIRKIPYFLMPLITIGSLYAYSIHSSFYDLIHSSYKYGYWYLWVLSIFYVFLYAVNKISCILGRVILSMLLWGVLFVLNSSMSEEWNDILSLWIVKQYWPFFIGGYFFTQFSLKEKFQSNNWIYTFSFILYIVSFTLWYGGMAFLYYAVAGSFVVFVLYLLISRENSESYIEKRLEYFGKNTLDIYIFHFFLIQLVSLENVGGWLEQSHNILIELLLGIIFSVVIAYLTIGIGMIVRKSNVLNKVVYGYFVKKTL